MTSTRALRQRYAAEIRERIGTRSGWKCEVCKVAHGELIMRGTGDDAGTFMLSEGDVFDAETGERLGRARMSDYCGVKVIEVVLTVAHLNHDETDNRDENLKHLCQLHHNRQDAEHRRQNAEKRRRTRGGQLDMGDMLGSGV